MVGALFMVMAVGMASVAAANAASLSTTVNTATPEQGIPVQLTFSGSTDASTSEDDVYAVARPAGGVPCQSTYSSDQTAAGGASFVITSGSDVAEGAPFSVSKTWTPTSQGSFIVCAWLEQYTNSGSNWTGPVSTAIAARGPQVSAFSVSLPTAPVRGQAFHINYTTQTDQQLSLASMIKPAGGQPCASSYELESQNAHDTEFDVFHGTTNVYGGPIVTTGTATEPAGNYLICTWIEGPSSGEVDAALTTPFSVPAPPAPQSPALAITSLVASTASGVAVHGTTAPAFAQQLQLSLTCARHTTNLVTTPSGGAFATQSALPSGCVAGDPLSAKVSTRASSGFLAGSVSASTTVAAPVVSAPHPPAVHLPRLLSGGRGRFSVRPTTIQIGALGLGRITVRWTRWTKASASGHGVSITPRARHRVRVLAFHVSGGRFVCLAVQRDAHGRRIDDRLALSRKGRAAWRPAPRGSFCRA